MRWVAAALAALLLPVVLIGAAFAGIVPASGNPGGWEGASEDLAAIPPEMLEFYREAGGRFGVPVALLAAVGKVECDHNRNPACRVPNRAGAVGPMQFLPETFARYADASGTPTPSILDPRDAVFAAAAKLAADGVDADLWAALHSYNRSDKYVAQVVGWAVAYGWASGPDILGRAVLAHPNLRLSADARSDVTSSRVDRRVLAVLLVLACGHRLNEVGPLISGHTRLVAGTDRISNHFLGRAVDLPAVDGTPVTAASRSARTVVDRLLALPGELRPDEIGSPWPTSARGVDTFSSGHDDHVHIAFGSGREDDHDQVR